MTKKLLLLVLLTVFIGLLFGGCNLNKNHNRRHWTGFKHDMKELHEEIDYFFLDYDNQDPWQN
ncbi:hypothetical protein ACFL54_04055 [Planctomycetota bacterium]